MSYRWAASGAIDASSKIAISALKDSISAKPPHSGWIKILGTFIAKVPVVNSKDTVAALVILAPNSSVRQWAAVRMCKPVDNSVPEQPKTPWFVLIPKPTTPS